MSRFTLTVSRLHSDVLYWYWHSWNVTQFYYSNRKVTDTLCLENISQKLFQSIYCLYWKRDTTVFHLYSTTYNYLVGSKTRIHLQPRCVIPSLNSGQWSSTLRSSLVSHQEAGNSEDYQGCKEILIYTSTRGWGGVLDQCLKLSAVVWHRCL